MRGWTVGEHDCIWLALQGKMIEGESKRAVDLPVPVGVYEGEDRDTPLCYTCLGPVSGRKKIFASSLKRCWSPPFSRLLLPSLNPSFLPLPLAVVQKVACPASMSVASQEEEKPFCELKAIRKLSQDL